jgi:hypothetical protein
MKKCMCRVCYGFRNAPREGLGALAYGITHPTRRFTSSHTKQTAIATETLHNFMKLVRTRLITTLVSWSRWVV